MIDAAAEHDQAEALTADDRVVRAHAAYDTPREVTGDLHDRVTTSRRVGEGYQVAFVMLVGVVAKRGAKLAWRMRDARPLRR